MNSVVGRVLIFSLAGMAAGLLTWFISDISQFVHISDQIGTLSARELQDYYVVFCAWGGFIGVMLGIADTILSGGRAEWVKVLGLGLAVGILSGVIGGALGMSFFGPLYVKQASTPFDFLRNVLARAVGWALIGALAGTADGWRKLSFAVGRNGFIGGLIGGILGGTTFEIIPYLLPGGQVGPISRLFAFVITGAMIGLFVALVQELLKEAWLKVMVGRNEGKEILIYQEETRIGRHELADVPLFGDPNIARYHAVIRAISGQGFVLSDISQTEMGLLVNGQRIAGDRPLRNGDQIQIGSKTIVFYERMTRTPSAAPERDRAAARPASAGDSLPSLDDLPTVPVGPGAPRPAAPQPSPVSAAAPVSAAGPLPAAAPRKPPQGNTVAGQLILKGARLVAVSGPYTGSTFPVRPGAVIGRNPDADIALPADSKASRTHARLVTEGNGIAIEDAGSTNGTYVNGQRITRQPLVGGDTIVVGTSTLRFE